MSTEYDWTKGLFCSVNFESLKTWQLYRIRRQLAEIIKGRIEGGDIPIEDVDMSVAVYNSCKAHGINNLMDLTRHAESEMIRKRGVGSKRVAELSDILMLHGLSWKAAK